MVWDWSFLGLAAGFLTTLAFLPQVIRTWRTRSTEDISLVTYATFSLGVLLWLLYGLAQGDIAITIANGITLVLALTIVGLKLRYG
jgi:MtN3 and saliva related transmembrane protein